MKLHKMLFASLLLTSVNVSANIISFSETIFDTDFTYGGVGGLRGTGTGDILLSGMSGTISKAYLYWHGPTTSSDPNFNSNLTVNGSNVTGNNIGFSDDNSWSQDNSQAYRADVTSLITGDGIYTLAGLSPDNSNGASIIVSYDDGDPSNNVDVVSFEGNDANFSNTFDPLGWNTTLSGINYTSGSASLLMGISDGQSFTDGNFLINGVDMGMFFNGTTVPQTPGSTVTNGALWDLKEVDITALLSPGQNTLNLSYSGGSDALSAIHYQVLLPAGSAPEQPDLTSVPEPTTMAIFALGILGLASRRKAV